MRLGRHCREHGQLQAAEDAFRRAMRLEPRQSLPYRELGTVYLLRGRAQDASRWFEEASAVDPKDGGLLVLLGSQYLKLRQLDKAAEFAREALAKANALRRRRYVAMARDNYRRVRRLVNESGAKLVCIQYPRRSLAELRNLFDDPSGVIFVDNEAPFDRALRSAPLTDYFIDFFGGDFGHCTEKGYRLLAQDIVDVILKALPSK